MRSNIVPPSIAGFTIKDLCRRWRCGSEKIRKFLRNGELRGINLASNLAGKPQFRITAESVREFEERRSTVPPPKPARRRKQKESIDFFPN